MATSAITTYLNDHLGGASAGLQLLDRLIDTSGTPEAAWFASSAGTDPIGTAGVVTGAAVVRPEGAAPTSATDPQAWHSPHRPTHLAVAQPHSEQR